MASRYQIVRYVPDPIADERVNIGIVVYGEGIGRARFLDNWRRVKQFGAEDIRFLREFARTLTEELSPQGSFFRSAEPWDEARMLVAARKWKNSIQVSDPYGSLRSPDELVSELARKFLRVRPRRPRGFRDRRAAAGLGARMITGALATHGRVEPADIVKRHTTLQGRLDKHTFDLVLQNRRPLYAAEALSFEVPDTQELVKDVQVAAWAIDDLSQERKDLPLGVIALPPRGESAAYERAQRIFEGLGAEFVQEKDVRTWADTVAQRVVSALR